MSDEREKVTAYVDGALSAAERAELEALLAERKDLRDQAEEERALRAQLRELRPPEPRPGFETEVRAALRGERRPSPVRWLLPLAAALLLAFWVRGLPAFVALEVARDHAHCFSARTLPAKVWGDEPQEIAAWLEQQGTRVPPLPRGAASLTLVGARYCSLGDRRAAHVYYTGPHGRLSLFIVPGPVRVDGSYAGDVRGRSVRLLQSAGTTVALVSEQREAVDAFVHEFARSVASLDDEGPLPTPAP